MSTEREGLFSWQWRLYKDGHQDRRNLALHLATVPLFGAGFVTVLVAPLVGAPWAALGGLLAMIVAIAVQGRGHAREVTPPVPFRGPLDVVARLLAEQLVTFPRYVLSGELGRAWRRAR